MNIRKRQLEFRSDIPISENAELAAQVVREVVLAGGRYGLRMRALHLEHRAISVDVDLPAEVGITRSEADYLREVGSRVVEAIQSAVRRTGAPSVVIAASNGT